MLSTRLRLWTTAVLFAALALLAADSAAPASASVCTLADHIRAANTNRAVGFCPAGTSHDIITITDDIVLSEGLPAITGTITIEGGGHSISGAGEFRIFDVNGGNLTINNLTLTEGRADHGGAVRLQAGQLAIYDSSFVGNKTEKSAGAIYASGGTLDIRESRFENNCALLADYLLAAGIDRDQTSVDGDGCVNISYTRSEIDGELQTNVDGGAIRLLNGAQAAIARSTFFNNRATYGGAISTSSRNDRLVISRSSFVGNRASDSGGAIGAVWTGGGSILVSGSSFVKNSAKNSGGAIYARENALDIANSTFSENISDYEGGALHATAGAEVTVTHATFIENRAQSKGDAISNLGGKLSLRNSIIASAGSADDCAGGLDQSVGNLSPDRTCGEPLGSDALLDELTASPAYYPPLDHSPAVDLAVAEFCLAADQLGTARPQGPGCDIGAIESTTAKPADFEAPPFCHLPDQIIAANTDRAYKACPAGNGADTIYLIRDFTLSEKLQPITSHVVVEGNGYTISGDSKYRIFDVDGGKLTVKNLTMTQGRPSNGGGGAIRLQNGGRAVVSDSRFIDNRASGGGAVYLDFPTSNNPSLTVNNSSFVGNYSDGEGGAIFAGSGSISVRNSSFADNAARWPGSGAIGATNFVRVDVENSTFIRNRPSAVAARTGATATLTHVTIQSQGIDPLHIRADSGFTSAGRLNLRNSIIDGAGIDPRDCAYLTQNIGNLVENGACSSMLNGDPMLEDATGSPAYFDLQAGSPAINAADARFCPETDQIGRSRAVVGRCDIGAIQSIPVRQKLTDCSVTTTHGLNLRDEPNGNIIGAVQIHKALASIARTPGWFQVNDETGERSGWISALYVRTDGDCG